LNRSPEYYVVKSLPGYEIYSRHINGLNLENISITTYEQDFRKAVILDKVKNATSRKINANKKRIDLNNY
jgi:hypothetical protein